LFLWTVFFRLNLSILRKSTLPVYFVLVLDEHAGRRDGARRATGGLEAQAALGAVLGLGVDRFGAPRVVTLAARILRSTRGRPRVCAYIESGGQRSVEGGVRGGVTTIRQKPLTHADCSTSKFSTAWRAACGHPKAPAKYLRGVCTRAPVSFCISRRTHLRNVVVQNVGP
jgi:hypothetical protein